MNFLLNVKRTMRLKRQKLATLIFFLIMLASVNANAVNVRASFTFSVSALNFMEGYFDEDGTLMNIRTYVDSTGHTRPMPQGNLSILLYNETPTGLLELGEIAPGQDFSIQFIGHYYARNRTQGAANVSIPARLTLNLRLIRTQQGIHQLQLRNISASNEDPMPPASRIRAISPEVEARVSGPATVNLGQPLGINLTFRAANPGISAAMVMDIL